jgi:hypothetical protein
VGDFPLDLERVGFPERLIDAARGRALVPTLSGQRVCPKAAKLIPGADADWLPVAAFSDVVPIRDIEDLHFFEKLGVPHLELKEFTTRLEREAELSVDSRAALVEGLLRNNLPKETHSPALLLDANGDAVPADARVFLMTSTPSA